MSDQWKPSVYAWPFKDAPEEFRRLSPFEDGEEELVIFVPAAMANDLFSGAGWHMVMPHALAFMAFPPKSEGGIQVAGGGFGEYSLHDLPDGGRVAITGDSQNDPTVNRQ